MSDVCVKATAAIDDLKLLSSRVVQLEALRNLVHLSGIQCYQEMILREIPGFIMDVVVSCPLMLKNCRWGAVRFC